jgi:hypothetical protein
MDLDQEVLWTFPRVARSAPRRRSAVAARILFVGDIHLGQSPAGLPATLADHGLGPRQLGPAAAWRATVDYACREGVDAVVLAGDVVESANARFEAYGHLQRGVMTLTAAGIDVLAVAGNHDVAVLPHLAKTLPGFHLLGADGRWSTRIVAHNGTPTAHLLGWSFPTNQVVSSPLSAGLPPVTDDLPVLGVLHCDLDAGRSVYAPVHRSELISAPPAGWFLGHIHKPSLENTAPPLGYLGSLVGLDPTETGRHGPWLVEITSAGNITFQQIPLAPLRWESIEVAVDKFSPGQGDVLALLSHALRECYHRLVAELGYIQAVGCRVRLVGKTDAHRHLNRALADPDLRQLTIHCEDVTLFLAGSPVNASVPRRDLDRLARNDDPPALLARQLLALERNDPDGAALIRAGREELNQAASHRNFSSLAEPDLDDAAVRELLLRAGYRALEELLAQQEEVS